MKNWNTKPTSLRRRRASRLARAGQALALDEHVALEALQAPIDLADVQRRDGAAEALLQAALDS